MLHQNEDGTNLYICIDNSQIQGKQLDMKISNNIRKQLHNTPKPNPVEA